jgi:hypothetical protein
MHENREISSAPSGVGEGRSVKAQSRTTDMHVLEKSDCAVVPMNWPNNGRRLPAEVGEERAQLEENIVGAHMLLTRAGITMSQCSAVCVRQSALYFASRQHPSEEPYAETRTYGSVRGAFSDDRPYRDT